MSQMAVWFMRILRVKIYEHHLSGKWYLSIRAHGDFCYGRVESVNYCFNSAYKFLSRYNKDSAVVFCSLVTKRFKIRDVDAVLWCNKFFFLIQFYMKCRIVAGIEHEIDLEDDYRLA